MNKYMIFVSMGFEIVALILGAVFIGGYLDDRYHMNGLITVGLIMACLVSWLVRVIVLALRIEKAEEEEEKRESARKKL